MHFEDSQYEQHRADNFRKLKPNAIPTLFDVPNPPAVFAPKRIKGKGLPKPGSTLDRTSADTEEVITDIKHFFNDLIYYQTV